jgi:ATP-binding cassette, subfamily B, heavy metal transporter
MLSSSAGTPQVHKDRRDWHNLKGMLPFLWEFRGRALFALTCLVLAKVANVGVPLVLKEVVEHFERVKGDPALLAASLPFMLLLTYGLLKLGSSLFNELRDMVFAKVRYRAMRRLATRVLDHLHRLSLRFHLDRRTGAVSRDLERGTRSVSQILNYMAFSVIPIGVEFSLVAFILLREYDPLFAAAMFGSVVVYVAVTFAVTEWRMDFRHYMNRLDSEANTRAFDSLINYETVKYFGNERMELARYDGTLSEWEDMGGQEPDLDVDPELRAGRGHRGRRDRGHVPRDARRGDGELSIGDLVLLNAFMLQLFIPLGFLGIVYRQIKYSLADMDLIFKLLEREPEIVDRADARPLAISGGRSASRRSLRLQPGPSILHGLDSRCRPATRSPWWVTAAPASRRWRA